MDSINEINIKVSFGPSGTGQQASGTLWSDGALPPPPPDGAPSAVAQSFAGSASSVPPPPGISSGGQQSLTSDAGFSKEAVPEPPAAFATKQTTGIQDIGPPEPDKYKSNNAAYSDSLPSPPEEDNTESSGTKNKGDKK